MTENKPIMIDGVDVSGCKKLDREYAPNYPEIGGYDWFNECKETSTDCQGRNCLFKQLARKTQECEKKSWEIGNLGYKIKNQRKEINERLKQLKAKEKECEELKKANIHIDNNRMVKSNKLKKIEEYCREQNLKADYTACEILQIIDEVE